MIDRTEALVDAIGALHEYHRPDSEAYQLRNPLLLKSYAAPGKHNVDEKGRRQFDSFLGGYKSAYFDAALKISGGSATGLTPEDKLKNLLAVYGLKQENDQMAVVHFLRKAIGDKDIDLSTPLQYFIEKK